MPRQFWLTPFTSQELEEWWTSQESFNSDPSEDLILLCELLGETPPPHRDPLVIPGTFLTAETEEQTQLWVEMDETNAFYFCRLCGDEKSILKRPDGTRLFHKGYCGSKP